MTFPPSLPIPLVTLHKRGAIGLNRTAADVLLGGRQESIRVTLVWDRPSMRLTIRPAVTADHRTHVLHVYRRFAKSFLYLIVAERFFRDSKRLRVRSARRFPAKAEGGTLIVDRAAESVPARMRAAGR